MQRDGVECCVRQLAKCLQQQPLQEAPFGKPWRRLELEYPYIAMVLQSAFHIAITMSAASFEAVCYFLPGTTLS